MKNTTDPRHTSRRIALASIFCWLFNEINTEESMVLSKEVLETESDEFDHDLVNFLVEGVKTHNQEIEQVKQLLLDSMENNFNLLVPLDIEISVQDSLLKG